MAGKVAIVTGAGTGLGAATTRRLVREGADVVAVGRRSEKLKEVADELAAEGPSRVAVVAGGTLIHRVAHVDEVAELVLFLSGSQSKSLTGAVIPFDAGFTAH